MMARPAVHAIREASSSVRLIAMAKASHQPLIERFGLFDDFVAAPENKGFKNVVSVWSAASAIRRHNAGAAVVMAPSFEAAFTTWLSGIRVRVGHDTDGRSLLLTDAVGLRSRVHRVDSYRDLSRALENSGVVSLPSLSFGPTDHACARRLFQSMSWDAAVRPIFVNPAAAKSARAWSSSRFRILVDRLVAQPTSRHVVIHARQPFSASQEWARSYGIAVVSDVSLPELAALLERCSLYVGNDSGPAHIAVAAGIDTVTIFGSSVPDQTGPSAAHAPNEGSHSAVSARFECAPCRERFFKDCPSPPSEDGRPPCLDAISVDVVLDRVNQFLDSGHC
ncbi:MAG: glycosyltransferase family 9 protein [Vicinamibacterales bacterium]